MLEFSQLILIKKFKKYLVFKKNYTVILSGIEKIEHKSPETKIQIDKN